MKTDEILEGYSIEAFLQAQQHRGWQPETGRRYARALQDLQAYLLRHGPADRKTLAGWRRHLQNRYTPSGVNACLAAANNYFRWCDRPDLVLRPAAADPEDTPAPVLTRGEYLRLLLAARAAGQHRLYLLVKVFVNTGVPVLCLDQVTAELIRRGHGVLHHRGGHVSFRCPDVLRQELLEYLTQNGIYHGPIFVTRSGQPINRSNLFRYLQELCRAAGVAEEKANPRSLRGLYRATQQEIHDRLILLHHQMVDHMLELEQQTAGWPAPSASDPPAQPKEPFLQENFDNFG